MITLVPAVGLFQARIERRELHLENARHLPDVLGDGRNIQVFAEIVGLLDGVAPALRNEVARDADQRWLSPYGGSFSCC